MADGRPGRYDEKKRIDKKHCNSLGKNIQTINGKISKQTYSSIVAVAPTEDPKFTLTYNLIMNNRKGFTIVEVLIIIAVIAVLATIGGLAWILFL